MCVGTDRRPDGLNKASLPVNTAVMSERVQVFGYCPSGDAQNASDQTSRS